MDLIIMELYATFNREGHELDASVMRIGYPRVDASGEVFFYTMVGEDESVETFAPGEFSNWFKVDEYGQKVYRDHA
jgi:hypothetical protein